MSQCYHKFIHIIMLSVLYLLTLRLHHCILPFIISAVSIPIQLLWYTFYQCHWHHKHCCSTNAAASVTLCILFYIYQKLPPMFMCTLSYHHPGLHWTIFYSTTVADPIMLSQFNQASTTSLLSLIFLWCNFCINFHVLSTFFFGCTYVLSYDRCRVGI